jgi:hypothetical protein
VIVEKTHLQILRNFFFHPGYSKLISSGRALAE